MKNNDLFLNLYNTLDDTLREIYNMNDYGHSAISRRINELKGSPLYRLKERGNRLDIIRNLRNSLVHIEKYNNEDNFTISTTLINALKEEIEDIKTPLSALKICKPINQVLTTTLDSKVVEVANKMLKHGYTHIPVLINSYLFGVFSQNTIFSFFANQKNMKVNNNTTIEEYIDYLPIDKHITEKFIFVNKDRKVEELIPLFSKSDKGKRLVMIFVTENGFENEQIIGIITSYDLLAE